MHSSLEVASAYAELGRATGAVDNRLILELSLVMVDQVSGKTR